MHSNVLFFVIIFSFLSCSSNKQEDAVLSAIPKSVEVDVICNPQSNSNYIGGIETGKMGIVTMGTILPDFSKQIKYDIQSVDQIVSQEDGSELKQQVHHIYYNMNEVMLLNMDNDIVKSITTFSPSLYLDNCIHVSSTVEDLKSKYKNLTAKLNFDDSMLYLYSEENSNILFMLMPDNILDQSKVNKKDGVMLIENIKPSGTIISIKVQN